LAIHRIVRIRNGAELINGAVRDGADQLLQIIAAFGE
jgi:hypothetical protein